jgi:ribosome-binding factor A
MSVRTEKVASLIKQQLSVIFQRNFSMQEYGFLTVTEVRVSPDLKVAKIYVSVFGEQERKKKSMSLLEDQKGFVRSELGHSIRLKFTPEIIFYLDDSLDRAMSINKLLDQIHHDDEDGQTREDAKNGT